MTDFGFNNKGLALLSDRKRMLVELLLFLFFFLCFLGVLHLGASIDAKMIKLMDVVLICH